VDDKVRRNEMVLGFQALMTLGHRISVAGMECHVRRHQEQVSASQYEGNRRRNAEAVSFLDEDEARRIHEWRE
uniref:hypothetical protein n=1 Tax=Streptomyces djakartensis TaxID=68193 RepID=UPI0034E029F6